MLLVYLYHNTQNTKLKLQKLLQYFLKNLSKVKNIILNLVQSINRIKSYSRKVTILVKFFLKYCIYKTVKSVFMLIKKLPFLVTYIATHVILFTCLIFGFDRKRKKDLYKIVVIGFVISFLIYKHVNILDFFVVVFAIRIIMSCSNTKISYIIAIILLIGCVFTTIINKPIQAEILALYTYYFLVIGLISEIVIFYWSKKTYQLHNN